MRRIQNVCQPRFVAVHVGILSACMSLVWLGSASAAPLNILYYGNSFQQGPSVTRSVADIVSDIAVAAGHDAPNNVDASIDGASLSDHLTYNQGVIGSSLAPGQSWNYVILQNYSTAPTHIGNLAQHRADSVALYQAVASNSPGVVPVLFETWARGPGHAFYTGPSPDFPLGPAQMQQELRDGYNLAAQDINAAVGSNIARIAPVGDAFESDYYDPSLYDVDSYHTTNRGTLLAALVVYATIYGDLSNSIPMGGILASLELPPSDSDTVAIAINLTAVPEPSSVVLLGMASIGLAMVAVKRGRSAKK